MRLTEDRSQRSFFIPSPLLIVLTSASLAAYATGCGKSMVKDVQVSAEVRDDAIFAKLGTNLDLGKIMLPALRFPIGSRGGEAVGEISLTNVGGANHIELAVDLTHALKISLNTGVDGSTLPNGNGIPMSLSASARTIGFAVSGSSRAYLAIDGRDVMLGFALVVPQLDGIGKVVPIAVDIFPGFSISATVAGVAGFFTSPAAGGNGLAFFVRAVGLLPDSSSNLFGVLGEDVNSGARILDSDGRSAQVASNPASSGQRSKIEDALIKFQNKGGTVSIK